MDGCLGAGDSARDTRRDSRLVRRTAGALAVSAGVSVIAPMAALATEFSYTGSEPTWPVPAGVTQVHVAAVGAPGGGGGLRAVVTADVPLPAGQRVLYVEVGGPGEVGGQGCPPINPCGPGGSPGGGFIGGGAGRR
jgi:hypothetical protein